MMPGTTISQYEIVSKLGGGGMGVVYKARDTKLDRLVALKFLPPDLSRDEDAKRRFTLEAKAASALNHPNICSIHDIRETEDGQLFIVMAYYDGQTLKHKLEQGPLGTRTSIDIIRQVADGLSAAHEADILHRDIKPANIIVTRRGRAVILDFGLAKLTTGTALTVTGSTLGTIAYMSPEQATSAQVDHRVDIWALGALTYEMLTGQRPFPGDYDQAVVYNILNTEPEPLSTINPDLPDWVEPVVSKALEKDPDRRYSSVSDFRADLEAPGIQADRTKPTRSPRRDKRFVRMYGAVAAAIVLAIGMYFVWGRTSVQSIDSIAVLPLANMSGDPDQEYFADGMTEALIGSLSKVGALKVISRQSVMRYKNSEKSLPQIAEELGVDAIVEGAVYREGRMVRVRAGLIRATTDESLWSDEFDREFENVLALHSDVATSIASEIEIAVTPEERARLEDTKRVDPEAYEAYLKGRFHWYKFTASDMATALNYFETAIDLDSTYALAYIGYADAIATPAHAGLMPTDEVYPLAIAAVRKALVLDDELAQAHDQWARINFAYNWDQEAAGPGFERAIELNPNLPDARVVYSQYLSAHGRTSEALTQAKAGMELDPLNSWFTLEYAQRLAESGRHNEALEIFERVRASEPNQPVLYFYLWGSLFVTGQYAEAATAASKTYTLLFGNPETAAMFEGVTTKEEYAGAMLAAAQSLEEQRKVAYVAAHTIATLYANAGETDRALYWLGKGIDFKESKLVYASIWPEFAAVREDVRFEELLALLNLPSGRQSD